MIRKIISGGQTGPDRAALDVAISLGYDYGGWVPKGCLDENGVIPSNYSKLVEAKDSRSETRTELNIRDSDATIILSHGPLLGGSEYTKTKAQEIGKPYRHIDLDQLTVPESVQELRGWLQKIKPSVLNVAGPRASQDSTIYEKTCLILRTLLTNQEGKFDFSIPN